MLEESSLANGYAPAHEGIVVNSRTSRTALWLYLLLLLPVGWLTMLYQPYSVDGDGVAYMDIADLLRTHRWAGAINGYWNPLYPAALAIGQAVAHPSRWHELPVYRCVNFVIFLVEAGAVLLFVAALDTLRSRWAFEEKASEPTSTPLLSRQALQLIGLGLLVIASQRELAVAGIKPDALLQALMMLAFAALLHCLATESLLSAALMGVCFGLAYLTKSFAFLVAFLSAAVLVVFLSRLQRPRFGRAAVAGTLALVCFGAVAGPYIAALSREKGRFDFGDSGALNYAWYAGGTEKMHVEPWMTDTFGSATVHLVHPDVQLRDKPEIYSYRQEPYGTYPEWFDPSFFHEHTVPHLNLPVLVRRDARNVVLVLRYLLNHPEGPLLLALLLATGTHIAWRGGKPFPFWLPMVLISAAMWGLYLLVNIEERYVTLAYLTLLLPIFAALRAPMVEKISHETGSPWQAYAAAGMVAIMAFLALGESLRLALDQRRSLAHPAWISPEIYGAAEGLAAMGVRPGEEIACMGTLACVNDTYWMRLAGVRTLTEVYNPDPAHLRAEWSGLPNRAEVEQVLRAAGAKVLVARFDPGPMNGADTALQGWQELGDTDFYALPLDGTATSAVSAPKGAQQLPWPVHVRTTP